MTKEELEILKKAEEIKRRNEEIEKKKMDEEKELKKIKTRELKRKREELALKEKNDRLLKEAEKKRIFDLNFPTFEQKKNEISQQITTLEGQLSKAKNEKKKIMKEFEPLCVHVYGQPYTTNYGAFTYVDCVYCGYENCIHEVAF